MLAAVVLAASKTAGLAIFAVNTQVEPRFVALFLMGLAVAFLFLALRVVMKLKKK
jgi:hypothetical protein